MAFCLGKCLRGVRTGQKLMRVLELEWPLLATMNRWEFFLPSIFQVEVSAIKWWG